MLMAPTFGQTEYDFTADVIISNDPKITGSLSGEFHYKVDTPVTEDSDKRMRIDYKFGGLANPPQLGPYEIYDELKVRNYFHQDSISLYSLAETLISVFSNVSLYSRSFQKIRYLYCPAASKCEAETYPHGVPRLWLLPNDTATPQHNMGNRLAYQRQDFTLVKRIWFNGTKICRMEYDNGKTFEFSGHRPRTGIVTDYTNWNCPEPQCHLKLDIMLGKKTKRFFRSHSSSFD